MKAVAAFSFATENDRVEALQEYQLAVTLMKDALKSTEDLISDASFLTHFLLLIHEVRMSVNHWYPANGDRLRPRKSRIGRNIFPHFYKFRVCDDKYMAASDTPLWSGGFA